MLLSARRLRRKNLKWNSNKNSTDGGYKSNRNEFELNATAVHSMLKVQKVGSTAESPKTKNENIRRLEEKQVAQLCQRDRASSINDFR